MSVAVVTVVAVMGVVAVIVMVVLMMMVAVVASQDIKLDLMTMTDDDDDAKKLLVGQPYECYNMVGNDMLV